MKKTKEQIKEWFIIIGLVIGSIIVLPILLLWMKINDYLNR